VGLRLIEGTSNETLSAKQKIYPSRPQLTQPERDQVIRICDHLKNLKYARALPNAFAEHGAIMAASEKSLENRT
jgi:hypothetical protein